MNVHIQHIYTPAMTFFDTENRLQLLAVLTATYLA